MKAAAREADAEKVAEREKKKRERKENASATASGAEASGQCQKEQGPKRRKRAQKQEVSSAPVSEPAAPSTGKADDQSVGQEPEAPVQDKGSTEGKQNEASGMAEVAPDSDDKPKRPRKPALSAEQVKNLWKSQEILKAP